MSSHPARRPGRPTPVGASPHLPRPDPLVEFLTLRLTDDLTRVWTRDAERADEANHPGMAAQVTVIDDLLTTLRSGHLPSRHELRILLHGYGSHPDYDPGWTDRLLPLG